MNIETLMKVHFSEEGTQKPIWKTPQKLLTTSHW